MKALKQHKRTVLGRAPVEIGKPQIVKRKSVNRSHPGREEEGIETSSDLVQEE
jgi:hypothetical protein